MGSIKQRLVRAEQRATEKLAPPVPWEVWTDNLDDNGATVIGPGGQILTAAQFEEYAARNDKRIIHVVYDDVLPNSRNR